MLILLAVYFGVLTLVSGWDYALGQFLHFGILLSAWLLVLAFKLVCIVI